MGSTQYKRNYYAKCPFFTRQGKDNMSIKCEGVVGKYTVSVFSNKQKMIEYNKAHCCDDYKSCPLYADLMKKWG